MSLDTNVCDITFPFSFNILYVSLLHPSNPLSSTISFPSSNVASFLYFVVRYIYMKLFLIELLPHILFLL